MILALLVLSGIVVYAVIYRSPARLPKAETRDALSWPFDKYSPWNMPLGSKAIYKSTPITPQAGYSSEWEVIAMDPNAPERQGYNRNDGTSLCGGGTSNGNFLVADGLRTPIANTTPGAGYYLPNNSGGVLKVDKQTVQEGNYIARCADTGQIYFGRVGGAISITGSGINIPYGGGHGGSAMSGVGGDLRKWEVTSSDTPIRHALKITLNGKWLSKANGGHRWPATNTDGGYDVVGGQAEYYGSWPEVNMGSLMAINPSLDINSIGLTTELGKRVAKAMQDYGAYVVDEAHGRDLKYTDPAILNIEYGSPIPSGFDSDMMKLWSIFNVVTNNTESTPGGCAVSDTTCVRRQPYAPDFGQTVVSPTPTPTPTPTPPIVIQNESFKEDFFNNITLSSTPVKSATVGTINNNWGLNAPASGLPVDNFSIRWAGTFNFDGSKYRFNASADDGVRVKVDGQTLIDGWKNEATTTYNKISTLSGSHTVTVEYYDSGWDAVAKANWVHADKCFDMTGDGKVDDTDLKVLSDHYSSSRSDSVSAWDLNNDRKVNSLDQILLVKQKGTTCN